MTKPTGQEVLILDGDEKLRRGLTALLSQTGLMPTAIAVPLQAMRLARDKFFAVALIDLDTPRAGEGAEHIANLLRVSPATQVLALAARKTFDVATSAFRAGARDVILKSPDQVDHLKRRTLELLAEQRRTTSDRALVTEALVLHEQLLRALLDAYHRAELLEERLRGNAVTSRETPVLVVDVGGWLRGQLAALLQGLGGYQVCEAASGGEALDWVGRKHFAVALLDESLTDLPVATVARAIREQAGETLVLTYAAPSEGQPGHASIFDGGASTPFLPTIVETAELVARFEDLRQGAERLARDRRALATLRRQHFELLRRYADLQRRLQTARH